jgi:hypothetical protein
LGEWKNVAFSVGPEQTPARSELLRGELMKGVGRFMEIWRTLQAEGTASAKALGWPEWQEPGAWAERKQGSGPAGTEAVVIGNRVAGFERKSDMT